jgi:hypothetical protein
MVDKKCDPLFLVQPVPTADHPHRFFKPVSIDRWVVVIYESDYISVHCLIFFLTDSD